MRKLVPLRHPILLIALSFAAALLFVTGCSDGGSSKTSTEATSATTAQGKTAPATTASSAESSQTSTLTITNSAGESVNVRAEIADTEAKREKGLMGRTALAEDAGMLFVFDREQPLAFWMKDTLIPLSIAYIDSNGRIVDIQDMQPLDETPHPSAEPAKYALEVNQGFFAARGIQVGDRAELPV